MVADCHFERRKGEEMKPTLIGLLSIFYLVVYDSRTGEVRDYRKFIDKTFCERAKASHSSKCRRPGTWVYRISENGEEHGCTISKMRCLPRIM